MNVTPSSSCRMSIYYIFRKPGEIVFANYIIIIIRARRCRCTTPSLLKSRLTFGNSLPNVPIIFNWFNIRGVREPISRYECFRFFFFFLPTPAYGIRLIIIVTANTDASKELPLTVRHLLFNDDSDLLYNGQYIYYE